MRAGPNLISSIILILVMLAIDTYVFMALRTLLVNLSPKWKVPIFSLYWLTSAVVVFSIIFYARIPWEKFMEARSYYLTFAFGLFMAKALIVVFLLADDGRRA